MRDFFFTVHFYAVKIIEIANFSCIVLQKRIVLVTMSSLSELVPVLLQYQLLLKMYHWQTHVYARHKASDELYDKLTEFIDHLVEYGSARTRLTVKNQPIRVQNMTDDNAVDLLEQLGLLVEHISLRDLGIRARRDDLVGYIHQALYLFQLA